MFHLRELEYGIEVPAVPIFKTVWTLDGIGFFDFDESHVIFNSKRSRSFAVVCIKTRKMLWKLNPTADGPFIVLRDFQNGFLLANDSTRLVK